MDILAKSACICSSYSQIENKWNLKEGMGASLLLVTLLFKRMRKWAKETRDFLQI